MMVGYSIGRASMQPPAEAPPEDDEPTLGVERVPTASPQAVDMNRPIVPSAPTRAFDAGHAYATIAQVDLDECRDRGLATGYAHALMTFAPDGHVANVALELPPPSTRDAYWCVDQALRTARVSPFDGQQTATVRRAFYVAPARSG
jgi:hypothetical protein